MEANTGQEPRPPALNTGEQLSQALDSDPLPFLWCLFSVWPSFLPLSIHGDQGINAVVAAGIRKMSKGKRIGVWEWWQHSQARSGYSSSRTNFTDSRSSCTEGQASPASGYTIFPLKDGVTQEGCSLAHDFGGLPARWPQVVPALSASAGLSQPFKKYCFARHLWLTLQS
jgi:hypothetical protein